MLDKDLWNHAEYPYLILFYHKKPETGQNHEKRISQTLSWSLQNHFLMDYTSFHTYLWQFQSKNAQFSNISAIMSDSEKMTELWGTKVRGIFQKMSGKNVITFRKWENSFMMIVINFETSRDLISRMNFRQTVSALDIEFKCLTRIHKIRYFIISIKFYGYCLMSSG